MKKTLPLLLLAFFALSLNSCFVNRSTVADGPVGKAKSARYSHAKQLYVFWGLLPVARPAAPQLPACGYQVKTSFNFIDMLVSTVTAGIFGMRSVKILVNKDGPCDPAIMKIEQKVDKEILKKEERDKIKP